jgi:hypothetical protein
MIPCIVKRCNYHKMMYFFLKKLPSISATVARIPSKQALERRFLGFSVKVIIHQISVFKSIDVNRSDDWIMYTEVQIQSRAHPEMRY